MTIGGLPLITYAPRRRGGGGNSPIHFHCLLHAKREEGVQKACKTAYVLNGRPLCDNVSIRVFILYVGVF